MINRRSIIAKEERLVSFFSIMRIWESVIIVAIFFCPTVAAFAIVQPNPCSFWTERKAASNDDQSDFDLQPIKVGDREFWAQQKELLVEMTEASEQSSKAAKREQFAKRRLALVGDTAYIGMYIFCFLWVTNENPFVPISYSLGAFMGLAYAYGLGKYVETVGGSIDDAASTRGAGVGEARFAFLILLFILVGRFRDSGIQEVPAITGFFTYQLASLGQGLKEIND